MKRNNITFDHFRIFPAEDFSIFAGFSCLQPQDSDRDLDDFIRNDAERHLKDRVAVTYVMADTLSPGTVLAFATLQNDAIVTEPDDLPEVRSGYSYPAYPAVKIGRFGVQLDMQGRRIGSLFLYLLKLLMLDSNRTGCRFVTVDARRDKKNGVDTTSFYEKNGFALLPCRQKTSRYVPMYFDLKLM